MTLRIFVFLLFLFLPLLQLVSQITVGKNVLVSRDFSSNPHAETMISVNPNNPLQMLACSYVFARNGEKDSVIKGMATVVYRSDDGGKTWGATQKPLHDGPGDPVCIWGNNGEAYYTGLDVGVSLLRSDDAGITWKNVRALSNITDKEWIFIDNTQSLYRGSIYIHGMHYASSLGDRTRRSSIVLYSSHNGIHFDEASRIAFAEGKHTYVPGNGAVFSDGTLIFVFGIRINDERFPVDRPNAILNVITSKNGGKYLEREVAITDWYIDRGDQNSGLIPHIAVDQSNGPFKDRVYVVWNCRRSGRGEIYFAYSDDKGKTWSKPTVVNDDTLWSGRKDAPDNLNPTIAVNKNGVIGILWQDRRDHPDNLGYCVRLRVSMDGGDTWLPSVRVSEKPHSLGDGVRATTSYDTANGTLSTSIKPFPFGGFEYTGGHYIGLANSSTGEFHAVWVDNRTGVSQLWTAPVNVRGEALRYNSAELSAMKDISKKVMFEFTESSYDRKSGRITTTARLKNTSKDTLWGPFRIYITNVRSDISEVRITNADNKKTSSGAIWDWTSLVNDGCLPPDGISASRQLAFMLNKIPQFPFRKDEKTGKFHADFVNLDVRVFATSVKKGNAEEKKK